jgi:hypothetical protein
VPKKKPTKYIQKAMPVFADRSASRPPDDVLAEAERRRLAALERSAIDELMGVPLPGESALDRRRGAGSG